MPPASVPGAHDQGGSSDAYGTSGGNGGDGDSAGDAYTLSSHQVVVEGETVIVTSGLMVQHHHSERIAKVCVGGTGSSAETYAAHHTPSTQRETWSKGEAMALVLRDLRLASSRAEAARHVHEHSGGKAEKGVYRIWSSDFHVGPIGDLTSLWYDLRVHGRHIHVSSWYVLVCDIYMSWWHIIWVVRDKGLIGDLTSL